MQTQVTCAREAAYSSDNRVGSACENSIRGAAELQFSFYKECRQWLQLPPVQHQHSRVVETGAKGGVGTVQVAQNPCVCRNLGRK